MKILIFDIISKIPYFHTKREENAIFELLR